MTAARFLIACGRRFKIPTSFARLAQTGLSLAHGSPAVLDSSRPGSSRLSQDWRRPRKAAPAESVTMGHGA
ncbi:hypothetical protein VTN96DRAFT_3967 [Rasamsonia emersonii]